MITRRTKSREINVHHLTVDEALEYILDEIEEAYFANELEIKVIHGYNRGVAIKNMIFTSPEIKNSPYVRGVRNDLINTGVSIIDICYHEG